MAKSETLRTLFKWMKEHDNRKLSADNLASFLQERYEWAQSQQRVSIKSSIVRIRNGYYSEEDLFPENSVIADLARNIQGAKVFIPKSNIPESEKLKLDDNPLNVLTEEFDIKRDFLDIPEAYANYLAPLKLDSYGKRCGIISDIHFPIHDRPAVLAAHAFLKKEEIDFLLLLGDIMDCGNLTRHNRRRVLNYTWREELGVGVNYIKSLRKVFPNIPIVYAEGNHENWFQQYIVNNASQIDGTYILQEKLLLAEHDIEWVDETRLMTYGDLFMTHGHKLGLGGGRNIATRLLDKHGVNIMVGHWHRCMSDDKRTLAGVLHGAWVNGCLSDQHPDYNMHNNSTHGTSIVDLHSNGLFHARQYKIDNGLVIG